MNARALLLGLDEVRRALGPQVELDVTREHGAIAALGTVVAAAASDAAYRSFSGRLLLDNAARPTAVGEVALIFPQAATAERTFTQVAQAAHLRTRVGPCDVAVETAASAGGLVSYWAYVYRGASFVILTLDTIDPQILSMTSFRTLVTLLTERLERADSGSETER